jgi:tetratricopeptide (TPR) repeat protein
MFDVEEFDVDEYLHLALHASAKGEHHACMTYLKKALRQQPKNAVAIYLLSAQHAELGLFERAITGMISALEIQPQLEIARFQLGLVLADRNRSAEATLQFSILLRSLNPAIRAYSEAMTALLDDNTALAQDKLTLGLSHGAPHSALSTLMRRFLDNLSKKNAARVDRGEEQENRVFLGAYGTPP